MFGRCSRYALKTDFSSHRAANFTRHSHPGVYDGFHDPLFGKDAFKIIEASKEERWRNLGKILTFPTEFTQECVDHMLKEALLLESAYKFLRAPHLVENGIPEKIRINGFLNCIAYIRGFETIEETEQYLKEINFVPDFFASGKQMNEHVKKCDLYGEYMSEVSLPTLLGEHSTNGLNYNLDFKCSLYKWFVAYQIANYLYEEKRLFNVILSKKPSTLSGDFTDLAVKSIRMRIQNHGAKDEKSVDQGQDSLYNFFSNSLTRQPMENIIGKLNDLSKQVSELKSYSFNRISARELIDMFCQIRNELRNLAVELTINSRIASDENIYKEHSECWEVIETAHLQKSDSIHQLDSSLDFVLREKTVDNTPSIIASKYFPQEYNVIQDIVSNLTEIASSWDQSTVQFELSIRAGEISHFPIKIISESSI